jgi:hypothetical protein
MMTFRTQCNHVLVIVVSLLASKTLVMDFEVAAGAADLALPSIALQDPLAQLLIR